MKIENLIELYLENLKSIKRYSSNTVKSYREDLRGFADFAKNYEKVSVKSITNKNIKTYLMELNEAGFDKKSISRKLASLRGLFKYAFQQGLLDSNPAIQIRNPKLERKLPEVISLDSFLSIYPLLDENKKNSLLIQVIFELLYGCALRVSELCGLNTVDIDLDNKVLKVRGKGNKDRIVPIGSKSIDKIKEYLSYRGTKFQTNAFLVNEKGERIYPRFIHRVVQKYLAKVSDVKKKSPHVLRHTAATHMLDRGADIRVVKEILGHENLSTTQIYTHVSIERLKSAYKKAHPKS
ncbi:MAG: tyrosine-type recombinase/integrase [Ignavibacteriaceae bacterium]|nr:tyrosine-type recombinase/integrase [Ignavibacteriaceae bacterium]